MPFKVGAQGVVMTLKLFETLPRDQRDIKGKPGWIMWWNGRTQVRSLLTWNVLSWSNFRRVASLPALCLTSRDSGNIFTDVNPFKCYITAPIGSLQVDVWNIKGSFESRAALEPPAVLTVIVYGCTDGAAFDCCWQHIKKLSTPLKEGSCSVLTADLLDLLVSHWFKPDTLLCLRVVKNLTQGMQKKPESHGTLWFQRQSLSLFLQSSNCCL